MKEQSDLIRNYENLTEKLGRLRKWVKQSNSSTARILSENYGVQVVFSEDGECKTSRERMTLPYDEAIDEALIMGMMG